MPDCKCDMRDREEGESEREWFKRCMCMHHWMQTDYYRRKLEYNRFYEEFNANSDPYK